MKARRSHRRTLQTAHPPKVNGMSEKMERALELPVGSLSGCANIEMLGNRRVVIDGCQGIIEYGDDIVRLSTTSGVLRFTGRSLSLNCLTQDSAVIEGFILSIEFLS